MKFIPYFKNKPAFKVPFAYGLGYKDAFGGYYYLFPFHYFVRIIRNVKATNTKTKTGSR